VVRTATGAATMLASAIPQIVGSDWNCHDTLGAFLRESQEFSHVGYVTSDGVIACGSSGQGRDVSDRPMLALMRDDPRTRVTLSTEAPGGAKSVIVVSVPVLDAAGAFDGYVSVSLPHGRLFRPMKDPSSDRPLDLITYNADAEILTATGGLDGAGLRLPGRLDLSDLIMAHELAFIDYNRAGDWRVFAVVPIVEGQVFALGSWPHRRGELGTGFGMTSSVVFPLAMWAVCLGVAFFAVQRMVIRPTRNLRARMLTFMRTRRLTEPKHDTATPRELREMENTWMRLAENVLHDEAELYDTIHQRTVLLKEVHHRVKNNLQLNVTILNKKVRQATGPQIRDALSDIRQRVLGIARVHQNLYETSTTERVHAGELLGAIAGQTVSSIVPDLKAIRFEESYADIVVYPDQAVPLSLAVTELLTNALKHLGACDGNRPMLRVRLERDGERGAVLEVHNSLADPDCMTDPPESTGLGLALVQAFTSQLDGTCEVDSGESHYCAVLRFPIADFDASATSGAISETA